MKVLFVLLHPGYVRGYESTLRQLLDRGHTIHLAFALPVKQEADRIAERLAPTNPRFTFGSAPKYKKDGWFHVARLVRALADYSRYMHPRYAGAGKLKQRVARKVLSRADESGPLGFLFAHAYVFCASRLRSARLSRILVRIWIALDDALPPDSEIDRFIEREDPDVVLATPIVNVASNEVEFIKSARRQGISTAVCVASWDNLTNKGLIRACPDVVFVWNDIQVQEAVAMHNIPRNKVVPTGAPRFDEWFSREAGTDYRDFCVRTGLDPTHPFLLYLGSSAFVAPDEVGFVMRWVDRVRSDSRFSRLGVLVRPHPQNADQWRHADLDGRLNVSIWPRAGAQPVDAQSRAEFFDSMAHSAAVVGINTTAMIEAAILGKSVYTVLDPEFAATQEGTLHFRYLRQENGGFLNVADSIEAHIEQLARGVGSGAGQEQTRRFVKEFVRPRGLGTPCTPILVDAIEMLASGDQPEPVTRRFWHPLLRNVLLPIVWSSAKPFRRYRKQLRRAPRRVLERLLGLAARWVRSASRLAAFVRARAGHAQTVAEPSSVKPLSLDRADRKRLTSELAEVSGDTIVLGPWVGSVNDELLYWLPFLRWLVRHRGLEPSRLTAVSRGGVASWYEPIAARYVDTYEHVDPEAIAYVSHERRRTGTPRAILARDVLQACGLDGTTTGIQPEFMLSLFQRFRSGHGGVRHVLEHLELAPLHTPRDNELDTSLPADFVAVSTAASHLAANGDVRALAIAVVERLPADVAVVSVDREDQAEAGAWHQVERLCSAPSTERVGLESAIVGHASGFVGPWGSLAIMALFSRVPVTALVSEPRAVNHLELDLAYRAAEVLQTPLTVIEQSTADVVLDVIGQPGIRSSID